MNAVTKALTNSTFFSKPLSFAIPIPKLRVFVLLITVLITAISLVYMKDLNRRLFNNYQNLAQANYALSVDRSKLLLEEGALSAQARVQRLASQRLGMAVPAAARIDIVKI